MTSVSTELGTQVHPARANVLHTEGLHQRKSKWHHDVMFSLLRILPVLSLISASFFGCFLGAEGSAIMTTGQNLVLCAIALFGGIFFFFEFSFEEKVLRLVFIMYICILFFISFFVYFLRIYLLSRLGLHFAYLFSFLIFYCFDFYLNKSNSN